MPYINKEYREELGRSIEELVGDIWTLHGDNLEGCVNYVITKICNDLMIAGEPRYHKINAVLGVLEAVKLEFYRRLGGPYEDGAIEKNGDIECYEKEEEDNYLSPCCNIVDPSSIDIKIKDFHLDGLCVRADKYDEEAQVAINNLARSLNIDVEIFKTWEEVVKEIKKQ